LPHEARRMRAGFAKVLSLHLRARGTRTPDP
jgi:hypothetical protein